MVENDPKNKIEESEGPLKVTRKCVTCALWRTVGICIFCFLYFTVIHVLHLNEMGILWDRIGMASCFLALIYASSTIVKLLMLKGKLQESAHNGLLVTALIFSALLFGICILAITFGWSTIFVGAGGILLLMDKMNR
jgi:hypothetical protein